MFNYLTIGVIVFALQMLLTSIAMPDDFKSIWQTEDIWQVIGVILGTVVCTLIWPVTLAKNVYDLLFGAKD